MTDNACRQPLISFPQSIVHLKSEYEVLSKLIYRNSNQHRSTKVFSCLKKASKIMQLMPSVDLESLNSQAERYLRSMQNLKVNTRDLTASVRCAQQLYKAISIGIEAAMWFNRSARLLHLQLSQLLFVPLYTIFLALTARCLNSLSIIIFHFDLQFFSLKSQLQHTAAVNPRHLPLVQPILPNLVFSKSTLSFINELRTVYTPQDDKNSQKLSKKDSDNNILKSYCGQQGNTVRCIAAGTELNSASNLNHLQTEEIHTNDIEMEAGNISTFISNEVSLNAPEGTIENNIKSEFASNSELGNKNQVEEDFGEIIGGSGGSVSLSSSKSKSKNKKSKKRNENKNSDNKNEQKDYCRKTDHDNSVGMNNNDMVLSDAILTNHYKAAVSTVKSVTAAPSSDIKIPRNDSDDMNSISNISGSHNNKNNDNDSSNKSNRVNSSHKNKKKSVETLVNNEIKAKKRKKMENDDIDNIFGSI